MSTLLKTVMILLGRWLERVYVGQMWVICQLGAPASWLIIFHLQHLIIQGGKYEVGTGGKCKVGTGGKYEIGTGG